MAFQTMKNHPTAHVRQDILHGPCEKTGLTWGKLKSPRYPRALCSRPIHWPRSIRWARGLKLRDVNFFDVLSDTLAPP